MEYVTVNDILKSSDLSDIRIRELLQALVKENIIQINGTLYHGLSGYKDRIEQNLDTVIINARLSLLVGEKYVQDNYLKSVENTNTTIIHGDNLGNILQGDNKSSSQSSSNTKNITTAKTGSTAKKFFIGIGLAVISAIAAAILSHIWK